MNAIGVVLAGGRSSRMGSDKAELLYRGVTLAERAFSTLIEAKLDAVYINKNIDQSRDLKAVSDFQTIKRLQDRVVNKGPLAGIHAGLYASLEKHGGQPVVFLPVDQPLMSYQSIKRLVGYALECQKSCHFQSEGQIKSTVLPLVIFDVEKAITLVEQIFQENSRLSVGFFLEHIGASSITHDNAAEFLNVNNPEDYQTLLSRKY